MWRSGRIVLAASCTTSLSPTRVCRERDHHDRHEKVEAAAGEPQAALNADVERAQGDAVWEDTSSLSPASSCSAAVGGHEKVSRQRTFSEAPQAGSSSPITPAQSSWPTAPRHHPHRYVQPGLEHLHILLAPASVSAATSATQAPFIGPVGRVIAQVSDRVLAVQFDTRSTPMPSVLPPVLRRQGRAHASQEKGAAPVSSAVTAQNLVQVGARASVLYEMNESMTTSESGGSSGGGSATAGPSPGRSCSGGAGRATHTSGVLVDGLIVRLNLDGTVVMLLDTGFLDLAVPRESLTFLRTHKPTCDDATTTTTTATAASSFLSSPAFHEVLSWLSVVGTLTEEQQMTTACILYHRGWRVDRLYLLERPDVDFLLHLPKPLRLSILEKAEWERDHHRQLRVIYRERVKEKDRRYLFSKYAGILSASVAFVGASSLFGWNYKNYLKQQRSYQMAFAVESLQNTATMSRRKRVAEAARSRSGWRAVLEAWFPSLARRDGDDVAEEGKMKSPKDADSSRGSSSRSAALSGLASDGKTRMVPRTAEESRLRQLIRRLDCEHPRVPVLTGYYGCGKSSLCRHAMEKEGRAVVFVDVRSKEDMLRGTIKALGVPNADACGDPLDFISEACHRATAAMRHHLLRRRRTASSETVGATNSATATSSGLRARPDSAMSPAADSMSSVAGLTRAELNATMPIIVLKLREGDNLRRVYEEAVALACDRRVCHFVIEVPLESLTAANTALPGLDFYMVPNFSREEAFAYTQHRLDPLDLNVFMDTVGTNSNDLDELFAAVHQRQASATEYTNQKLLKSIRQLKEACASEPALTHVVKRLSEVPYDVGMEGGREDSAALHHPALRDIVLYNPIKDLWLFNNEVLHTAAQCCF